ncbi:SapB/AmfS family lanthipeptide [Streptomyces sp. WM6378]|nr:SapB/AmfS family lanthipeptide [Streptomyces sp. WM6378]
MVLLDLQQLPVRPEPPASLGLAAKSAGSILLCPSMVTVIFCFDEPE